MIDYNSFMLGKSVEVITKTAALAGIFEGMQVLGPPDEGSLFVIIKVDEDRTTFIPESRVERIYLVGSIFSDQAGEGS